MIKNFILYRLYRRLCVWFNTKREESLNSQKIKSIESGQKDSIGWVSEELVCLKCLKRGINVYPLSVPLKNLECGCCFRTGYMITTGQYFDTN